MSVNIDHPRSDFTCTTERHLKEVLGGYSITLRRQHEINGFAGGIHRSIQIGPDAAHANVGLIDSPRTVGLADLTPNPAIQLRRITEDPSADRRVVNGQTSFDHQLFDISKCQTITQVPTDTQHNHLTVEMPSPEKTKSRPHHCQFNLSDRFWPVCDRSRI